MWGTDLAAVADVYLSDLICFMPIVLCNILAAKVPLFRRNPKTGEEEKAFAAVTMAVQALLIAAVLVLMGKLDAPVLHLIYMLLGLVLVCTNTYSLLIRKDGDWWGIYVALKLLLFASVALHSYGVPVFVNDVTGIVIAFCCIVAGFLAAQIMFGVVIASIVIGAAVGFYAIPVYRRYLQERRRKAILLQFRDMLDSLSNSFSAGKNTPDAFTDAYSDLKLAYGEQAPIVKEMAIIVSGLHNNFVIEDLLRDMSARCGIDDINSFAETFAVCNRLGGNLKKVVVDSRGYHQR